MTALQKWNHPGTGQQITFDSRRPGRLYEPDPEAERRAIQESPEYKYLTAQLAEAPAHEARHAVVGQFWGFKTVQARADLPLDDVAGSVQYDFGGETWDRMRIAESFVTTLAGPLGEKTGPPAWPLRLDDGMASDHSDEKQLARLAAQLNLSEKQYNDLVDITRRLVNHPAIKRATDYTASMLGMGMTLDGRMLKDIYDNAWKTVQEEAKPPTTEELEHAVEVEQHRSSMLAYLHAADEYRKQEEAKALRRECDRLARDIGIA